jgi:UDP-GlcNAc:undecaprenyl-phosphate GlcNAc-1-phosphate transferase
VILGVPILDTAFSFVRRLARRQSISQADRGHLHHRLMRLGHGPRRSVVILWLWTALLSAVALVPTYLNRGGELVPLALAGAGLLLFAYFHPGVRRRDEEEAFGVPATQPEGGAEATAEPEEASQVIDLSQRRRSGGGRGS